MWRKGWIRGEHSAVCTALEERLGFQPVPESRLLPQQHSAGGPEEGGNNLEKNTEPRT